jgi:hypothetical protein
MAIFSSGKPADKFDDKDIIIEEEWKMGMFGSS